MEMSDYINNMVKQQRREKFNSSDQLSLGELISKIKDIINKHKFDEDRKLEEIKVYYDFEYLFPLQFSSWRGSYDELALDFNVRTYDDKPKEALNILEFLKLCEDTLGKTFYGYKGGDYIMDENTPIWVATYGNSGNTALVDVMDNNYEVILITGWRQF